jgi:hypothetical protein
VLSGAFTASVDDASGAVAGSVSGDRPAAIGVDFHEGATGADSGGIMGEIAGFCISVGGN